MLHLLDEGDRVDGVDGLELLEQHEAAQLSETACEPDGVRGVRLHRDLCHKDDTMATGY